MTQPQTIQPFSSFKQFRLLPLLLAGVLWAYAPAGAQEGVDVFGDVIDVRVVNLEVVVTEKGNRVTGLGPDDFILTVDRQEVPIEYFTEVLGGTAVAPSGEVAGGTVPALAPGAEVGTSYLVFIDEFFSRPTDRNRLLNRMIEQLPNLGLSDRMAIVAFSGKKVEMLSTWSDSVPALTRVLDKARDRPAFGLQRISERRLFEAAEDLDGPELDRDAQDAISPGIGLTVEERQQVDMITNQTERVILAASSALRSFANPPGRKVMLLLSGGWPYNPAQWVVNDISRTAYELNAMDGSELYKPLIETANRLSYTLYPVDVPGVSTVGVGAEEASPEAGDLRRTRETGREQEEEFALLNIARETGGKALLDSANLNAFERVVGDTRSYYWIGFTPTWKGDDTSHKVEIKPRRKGLKIRSRESFSDLSRETEVTMMVESALVFGNPPSAAQLDVEVGRGKRSGFGKAVVPVRIRIPLGLLTFLPQGDAWLADTELRVAVIDEEGNTSDIPVIPVGVRAQRQPEADDFSVYETKIKLRRKPHDLVISIYDKPSGRILSAKLEVNPG